MAQLSAPIAAICAAAALSMASGDGGGSIVTPAGVNLRAHVEGGNRLVVLLAPTGEVGIAGRLGVHFAPRDDRDIWTGEMPGLVTTDDDYFERPVLHVLDFDPDRLTGPARLGVAFGACLPVSGVCVPEEAEVTLERGADGAVAATLATVGP